MTQRTISDAEIRVLAERAYPDLKPSGFCSKHHSSQPPVVDCTICFPDLPALLLEHVRVHHEEQAQIAELRRLALQTVGQPTEPENGDWGNGQ